MSETAVSTDVVATGGMTAASKIDNLNAGALGIFSTFPQTDRAGQVAVYAAITDAEPIGDHLGTLINLANVVAQVVEVADADGNLVSATRMILVDADGTAYAGLSEGLYRSLVNIFGLLGNPSTWAEPLPVTVVEAKSRKGYKFYTIKLA